jgi:hypothetical protein
MGGKLQYGLFIAKEVDAISGNTFMRENPATELLFAEIAEAQKEDVE